MMPRKELLGAFLARTRKLRVIAGRASGLRFCAMQAILLKDNSEANHNVGKQTQDSAADERQQMLIIHTAVMQVEHHFQSHKSALTRLRRLVSVSHG